jgi:hypothetical protein
MKYAVKLISTNGQASYLDVKGRHTWKTKRTAQKYLAIAKKMMANGWFLHGVVGAELDQGYFA